jgi:hypothetical protein
MIWLKKTEPKAKAKSDDQKGKAKKEESEIRHGDRE